MILVPGKESSSEEPRQLGTERHHPDHPKSTGRNSPNQPPGHLNLSLVYLPDDRNGTPEVKEPLCVQRKQGEKIKKKLPDRHIEQTKVNLNTNIFIIDKI